MRELLASRLWRGLCRLVLALTAITVAAPGPAMAAGQVLDESPAVADGVVYFVDSGGTGYALSR